MSGGVSGVERRVAFLVIGISAGVIAFWVVAALLMTGRGFDLTDEGYYLLSYRWWSSTPRTFTGVQYLYGPVFELFGYDVRALRAFRLLTILGTHVIFAWAFMTWLRSQGMPAAARPVWMWAGGLAIVASGGITYGRLPLSPGYNDVALLGSLLLATLLLRTLVSVGRHDGQLPLGPAIAAPPLILVLMLAKWASAVILIAFVGVLAIVALRSLGSLRCGRRWALVASSSTVVSVVIANGVVGGFSTALPPMLSVNKLAAASTNSPLTLVLHYLSSGLSLLAVTLFVCVIPIGVGLLGLVLHRLGFFQLSAAVILSVPLVLAVMTIVILQGRTLGAQVFRYSACLVGLGLLVVVAARVGRDPDDLTTSNRRDDRGAVVALLLCLPAVQAFGTGNPLFAIAVNEFAAWMALFLLVCATLTPGLARMFALATSTCAVVVAGVSGGVGLLAEPYRTDSFDSASQEIGGSGPVAHVKISSRLAREIARVRSTVGRDIQEGRPMIAFDELPGLVLALGGRSVGEAWYPAVDDERVAAGLREACRNGNPWGSRQPIIFFNRDPRTADMVSLRECGIELDRDYTENREDGSGPPLDPLYVYVPVGEGPSHE